MRGKMIVIEGLDGSGKQTQTEILFKRIKQEFPDRIVLHLSFPNYTSKSSGPVQMFLNGEFETHKILEYCVEGGQFEYAKHISYLYAIDRFSTFMTVPEGYDTTYFDLYYNQGAIIVSDRYTTSNMLHQTANLKNDTDINKFIKWLRSLEYNELNLPEPDLVVLLEIDPSVSIKNINSRYNNDDSKKDILENLEMLEKAAGNALFVSSLDRWTRLPVTINKQMKPIEYIHSQLYEILKASVLSSNYAKSTEG